MPYIDKKEGICIIDIQTYIRSNIETEYLDYDNAFYDKEDNIWWGLESVYGKFAIHITLTFEVSCDFDIKKDLLELVSMESYHLEDIDIKQI